MPRGSHQQPVYKPKPEEIREECERIQRTWTPRQERERAGRVDRRWTAPEIDSTDVDEIDQEIREGADGPEEG